MRAKLNLWRQVSPGRRAAVLVNEGKLFMERKSIIRRRSFLRRGVAAALGGVLGAGGVRPALAQGRGRRPNVVYISCDQMRADAMGCMGNADVNTPHLDKLARQGVLFENWITNNPVCLPSRISVFTGRYPHEHGQLANIGAKKIDRMEGTLLDFYVKAGYRTGWVGKNHTYEEEVLQKHLDYVRIRSRSKFRAYNAYIPPWWHTDFYLPAEETNVHLNTEESVAFIRDAKPDEPFFLHVSYFDPHPPYMAPAEYTSKYSSSGVRLPKYIAPEKLGGRLAEQQRALGYDKISESDLTETLRYYYASVEYGVDAQVGRIMEAIHDAKLAHNTIVIFTADHGDFMGHHHMVRKGMFLYEALLHVPMIWFGPGYFDGNSRVKNLGQHVDIMPTLMALNGAQAPAGLSGRSLEEILRGKGDENEDHTVFASAAYSDLPEGYFDNPEPRVAGEGESPFHTRVEKLTWKPEKKTIMARTKDWKLILSETRDPELYDMRGGNVEQENVYGRRGIGSLGGRPIEQVA